MRQATPLAERPIPVTKDPTVAPAIVWLLVFAVLAVVYLVVMVTGPADPVTPDPTSTPSTYGPPSTGRPSTPLPTSPAVP